MNDQVTFSVSEAEVRDTVSSWLAAVQAVDFDAIMSHYLPDVVAFDAASELRFQGKEAYRKQWEDCMTLCPGPMIFEVHDLNVTAGEEVAFAFFLTRCGGIDTETGEEKASWLRGTACYRKTGGRWLIAHEHFSAPFDMEGGKALLDLER